MNFVLKISYKYIVIHLIGFIMPLNTNIFLHKMKMKKFHNNLYYNELVNFKNIKF